MTVRLVVDTNNILFRVAAAHGKYNSGSATDMAGLAMHSALMTLRSHYNKVKPDHVALSFEGTRNWRKAYTKSEKCVSGRLYKGNRIKDESMEAFFTMLSSFEELARGHTAFTCLGHPELEGDDCIGAYVQYYAPKGDQIVILSGDKDFLHMLKYPNVTLLNPDKLGAKRDLYDEKTKEFIDPEYFMFEKAFRGDKGDNVMPAYPRIRSTRLKKAFTDEYERTQIMNETWQYDDLTTGEAKTFRVGDLFEENHLLMNLERQPPEIREIMFQMVENAEANKGKFSLFHFQKFLGQHQLNRISEEVTNFVDMLSGAPAKASAPIEQSLPPKGKAQKIDLRNRKNTTLVF
jgi:5'-3' exonuclease, N-terminal resolvase-like domain